MRGKWIVTAVLLGLVGCYTPRAADVRPTHPEELVAPPKDDPRYSGPIRYPSETLNQGLARQPAETKQGLQPRQPIMPAGGRMGGGAPGGPF